MTEVEARLDEVITLVSEVGKLVADALIVEIRARGHENGLLLQRAREARAEATAAEQRLIAARGEYLARLAAATSSREIDR